MTNEPRTFTLPSDLGAQIGRDTLAKRVRQVAGGLAARLAPELPRDDQAGTAAGSDLLGLVTYCYASGALSSRAITELAEADPIVRSFCGDEIPERDEVAGFRRAHRTLIQECLKRVYEATWQALVGEPRPGRVPDSRSQNQPRPSQPVASDPDDLLRQINERISRAAEMDCWSRDW